MLLVGFTWVLLLHYNFVFRTSYRCRVQTHHVRKVFAEIKVLCEMISLHGLYDHT